MVVMSESGYIKRIPISSFHAQKRNGIGIKTQDDITMATIRTNTIDNLLVFTDKGQLYKLLVNDIPVGTNAAKGTSIKALVEMDADEKVETIYSIYRGTEAKFVVFVTQNGMIKKTPLEDYAGVRKKKGLAAIKLKDDDSLVDVLILKDEDIIIGTAGGKVIRINSDDIGISSRVSQGLKGIKLDGDDYVTSLAAVRDLADDVAVFTSKGYGKRVPLKEINTQNRAGKGLIIYKPDDTRGNVVALSLVNDNDSLLLVGDSNSICISASQIPVTSRVAKGNVLIKGNSIVSVSKV
jgi:DNA gyrase subunit A